MYDGLLAMRGKRQLRSSFSMHWSSTILILRKAGTSERRFFICLAVTKGRLPISTGTGVRETPPERFPDSGSVMKRVGDEVAGGESISARIEAIRHLNSLPAKIERLQKAIQRKNI